MYPIRISLVTLIEPPQPLWRDWLPVFVSIVVVILGGLVTYYVNMKLEHNRSENETRKRLRDERKELYKNLSHAISSFKSNYLDEFANLDMNDSKNQYGIWIMDADVALWKMKMKSFRKIRD